MSWSDVVILIHSIFVCVCLFVCTDLSSCPRGCSNHGVCTAPHTCECKPGWEGDSCERRSTCPNDCNNHGLCFHGDCYCYPGYTGRSCHTEVECPSNRTDSIFVSEVKSLVEAVSGSVGVEYCSGHGTCHLGHCFCDDDYFGNDCSTSSSLLERMDASRKVRCDAAGSDSTESDCSGHGECYLGQCQCETGWYGTLCGIDTVIGPCPNGCSGHGVCEVEGEHNGQCSCYSGYSGVDCNKLTVSRLEELTDICVHSCGSKALNSHGQCVAGECVCYSPWHGNWCNENSQSPEFRAVSSALMDGQIVSSATPTCPNDCSVSSTGVANGFCSNGACVCRAGYGGLDCSIECPNQCSQRGTCAKTASATGDVDIYREDNWKCFCQLGWTGRDCSDRALKRDSMVTSSIVGIAVVLFIFGLLVVPLCKAIIEQKKQSKRDKLASGPLI